MPAIDPSNPGGAAPAGRQCSCTKSNGHRCRDWALRGHDLCFRHHRFAHAPSASPIDVPLLEDEDAIVYLLSQTLRALAWGTIPVPNGRALLAGCRLAHTMHSQRLQTAKFRLKLRRLNIPEHEIFDAPALSSDPVSPELEPDAEPDSVPTPPRNARFRDLKKDWDKELLRTENAITDMYAPRYGETREEFKAARATPFQDLVPEKLLEPARSNA